MDPTTTPPAGQFRFEDSRHTRIHRRLLLISPGVADFFFDACRTLAARPPFATASHMVGHAAREIDAALRAVLAVFNASPPPRKPAGVNGVRAIVELGVGIADWLVERIGTGLRAVLPASDTQDASRTGNKDTRKRQVRGIAEGLGLRFEDPIVRKWEALNLDRIAHRDNLDPPRPVDRRFLAEWEDVLTVFDVVLHQVESKYLRFIEQLDELLRKEDPTGEDADLLHKAIPNNRVMRDHFFGGLNNPKWLPMLRSRGFFTNPPPPSRDEERGTISFPTWSASQYLARMAKVRPDEVVEILGTIQGNDNPRVLEDLVEVLLAISPAKAAPFTDRVCHWAETPHPMLLLEKVANLAIRFSDAGLHREALKLARSLLEPALANPDRVEVQWEFSRDAVKLAPRLADGSGLAALSMFCDLLDTAIAKKRGNAESKPPNDHSYIWLPSIGTLNGDHDREIIESLAICIRTVSRRLANRGTDVKAILAVLDVKAWLLFRRLALDFLQAVPEADSAETKQRVLDKAAFDNPHLRKEYFELLARALPLLSAEEQGLIWGWIEVGPKPYTEDGEEARQRHKRRWQRDRLTMAGAAMPDAWKEYLAELVEELGQADHPERLFHVTTSSGGPKSPRAVAELKALPLHELLKFLVEWEPPKDGFMTPTRASLGGALSTAIGEAPAGYAASAMDFVTVDPTYVRAVLSGFREGMKAGNPFDWEPVLKLIAAVAAMPAVPAASWNDERDIGWGGSKTAGVDLLIAGLEATNGGIPLTLRQSVWDCLSRLLEDPEPTPKDEEQLDLSDPTAAADLAINTIRGRATQAVIQYALWVHHHLKLTGDAQTHGVVVTPEVFAAIEQHLDPLRDPSLAIRAVFGQWLPQLVFLAPEWVATHMPVLFPTLPDMRRLREACWNTYLMLSESYESVFSLVEAEYRRAITDLTPGGPQEERGVAGSLARHLMPLLWRGTITFAGADSLLDMFYQRANDDIRAEAMTYVGRSLLGTTEAIPADVARRIEDLIERRVALARGTGPEGLREELAAFGWAFASEKLDAIFAITRLLEILRLTCHIEPAHLVMDKLILAAPTRPAEVTECLELLVDGAPEPWSISGWREDMEKIFAAVFASNNAAASDHAVRLINKLAGMGYPNFKSSLPRPNPPPIA